MFTRPGSAVYTPPPSTTGTGTTPAIDPGITSLAQLLAVSTVGLAKPCMKLWINAADGTSQLWILQPFTGGGGQQPNDYSASNVCAWYKSST
jgi:hypothetical protein